MPPVFASAPACARVRAPDAPVRIEDRRANRGVVVRDDVVGVASAQLLVVGPMQATRREDVGLAMRRFP
jgi:hypothetical protein